MKPSRLAAWLFVAAVGGAWLASAAGVTRQPPANRLPQRPSNDVRLDALAADVQTQAQRLRHRLANAPAPEGLDRNPFSFPARRQPARVLSAAAAPGPAPALIEDAAAVAAEPAEPPLDLIGIAESRKEDGVVRTAMITGGPDVLMMVTAGQQILGRYDVAAVGADAVELKDVTTGAVRRLVLR